MRALGSVCIFGITIHCEDLICILKGLLNIPFILFLRNAGKPVKGRVTNNVGEIQAAIYAIKIAVDLGIRKLSIYTDSCFLINSITKWVSGWKKRGWRLKNNEPVKNVDDFKELDELLRNEDIDVKWVCSFIFIQSSHNSC